MGESEQVIREWEEQKCIPVIEGTFALQYSTSKTKLYKLKDRFILQRQRDGHWFRCGVCDKIMVYSSISKRKRSRIRIIVTTKEDDDIETFICRPCWLELKGTWAQEEVNKALEACDHARSMCSVKSTDST